MAFPQHSISQLCLGCTILAHLEFAVCALVNEPAGAEVAQAAGPGDEVGIRFDNRKGVIAAGHSGDKVEKIC